MNIKLSTNRKLKRMFANILSIVAILAIAFPAAGSAYAQAPNPWFTVFPEQGVVEGWSWPLDAVIHMTIEDPSTDVSPDFERDGTMVLTPWDPDSGATWLWIDFSDAYYTKPGDVITLTDGTTERTHVVQNLAITEVNPDENTVDGSADGWQNITLWSWEGGDGLETSADGSGNWSADFDDVGFDLVPGYHVRAEVWDEDGDDTAVDWEVANPRFTVFPEREWFDGNDWPDGATVYITVANKAECTTEGVSSGNFFNGGFPEGCDIAVGDVVTFTDGETIRTHTIQNLAITDVNKEANTVVGTADVGALIYAWVHEYGYDMQLQVDDGTWLADFGSAGLDLVENMGGRVEIRDEFGNATSVDWYIPNPWFTVFPQWDAIEGWNFPLGAEAHLAIDDPSTEDSPDYEQDETVTYTPWGSWELWVWFDLAGLYDVKAGDIVTLTYGDTVRTHVVQNLAITKANHEDDTIKGIADAGANVNVWPHATGQEQLAIANPQGKWNVDFTGIYDLMPGDGGRARIWDETGNATEVEWYIPKSRIIASITEDWFYLQEFSPDTTLDFTVYEAQGEKPIWQGTLTTDGSGFAWIDADSRWNLEPGNYLLVRDGQNTKDLVIEGFTFDLFDLSQGLLQGTVPGQEGRFVWVGIGFENDGWSMEAFTDADGNWVADFGNPVPTDYWWVAAQIFDDDGDATELRPARTVQLWVAAFTYDIPPGYWNEEQHTFHFEWNWGAPEPGTSTGPDRELIVSSDAQSYDGYVLLGGPDARRGVYTEDGLVCEPIDTVHPDQPTRFITGWVTDYPMTYDDTLAYFDSITASVVWDDGQSTELVRHEILSWSSVDWAQYVCTFTADLILASQPDWVDSGITVSVGQTFTVEAFGLMNPCSDTYPNGGEICIFYTPVGGEWAVPSENEFGIFPGPGLPFMALLGRIGDGEPFYIGEGGTFTAQQSGTLWFTPNDNLRTDNQGAYGVMVGLEP